MKRCQLLHFEACIVAVGFAVGLSIPARASSKWVPDGVPISLHMDSESPGGLASDGQGGAIVTWSRGGLNQEDIYVHRVGALGNVLWTIDGVGICTAPNRQLAPQIVSDGSGGAIVAWQDNRAGGTYDVYIRRIDSSGNPLWTADGVAFCTATGNQQTPQIVSDGAGGAIVVWEDYRGPASPDIYVRRIDSSGNALWTSDGVAVCTATNSQQAAQIVSDGAGGAIVVWQDGRSGTGNDIYVRRISSSGSALWLADGVPLSTATNSQQAPQIVSDGAGGAVVAWQDNRSGTGYDIYARRVDSLGNALWASNGVAVCTAPNGQTAPQITSDGAGGAIVVWEDGRSSPNATFAQRVSSAGATMWPGDGKLLGRGVDCRLVADGSGGAIVAWTFQTASNSQDQDIYVQRLTSTGGIEWAEGGIDLCNAVNNQGRPLVVGDGNGEAIVAWQDFRVIGNGDIYSQRVGTGHWGHSDPILLNAVDIPSDQGGHVALNWTASGMDVSQFTVITHYSIWRAVDPLSLSVGDLVGQSPAHSIASEQASHRRYIFHDRTMTTDYYWEWLGDQMARYSPGYSIAAATRADSIAGAPAVHYFQVIAHTNDPSLFYESNVVTGYSVDNLAPSAPSQLVAVRMTANSTTQAGTSVSPGDVLLTWKDSSEPDVRDFSIYRSTSNNVEPTPQFFLARTDEFSFVDNTAPLGQTFYYVLTATDVHDNSSVASNIVNVGPTTGASRTPPLRNLVIVQNYPNPFAEATAFEIGLPRKARMDISVYDVTGRKVRSEMIPERAAGWIRVPFDGRDERGNRLASGVYFYKVLANGETATRKIVITR